MVFYFEDMEIGAKDSFGPYEVTREEVLDFAGRYDPQPFHLDDAAAAQTLFGRVAASGWHSCAMMMRMFVDHLQRDPDRQQASLGALGVDDLRWLKPIYPGDVLRAEAEVIDKKASRSKAMGTVRTRITVFNQKDEAVMTLIPIAMVRMRPQPAPA